MAQRSAPAPGEDYLDDAITRFGAQKTATGLVLSRAFRAIHNRFLALGGAIAGLVASHEDTAQRHQQRINDHRIELDAHTARQDLHDSRITDLDRTLTEVCQRELVVGERLTKIESQERGDLASLGAFAERVKRLEASVYELRAELRDHVTDEMLRRSFRLLADQTANAGLLRATADLLDPPRPPAPTPPVASTRELYERHARRDPARDLRRTTTDGGTPP